MTIGRRGFLLGSGAAAGGIIYSNGLAAMLAETLQGSDNAELPMVQRDAFINQEVNAFDAVKRKLVSAMSETLIPKTDTPGANDAGVPKFIEILYAQWMGENEKILFDGGLVAADAAAQAKYTRLFADCDSDAQKSLMEAIEEKEGEHPWFAFGGDSVAKTQTDIPFLALFKEIAVTGFFMSEVGAQQVLRFSPMPGEFDGELGLSSDESSWAATPLM